MLSKEDNIKVDEEMYAEKSAATREDKAQSAKRISKTIEMITLMQTMLA